MIQKQIRVLINLYEIGIKGFLRVSGDVVDEDYISPCLRARTQGDMPMVVVGGDKEMLPDIWQKLKTK